MVWDPTYGGQIAPQNTTPTNFARDPRVPVTPPQTTPYAAASGPFYRGQALGEPGGFHVCVTAMTMDQPPAPGKSNDSWHWAVGPSSAGGM